MLLYLILNGENPEFASETVPIPDSVLTTDACFVITSEATLTFCTQNW